MDAHVDVPVGINAPRWSTHPAEHTVLVVVHNVTALTRLLDVLPVFDSDPRVQLVLTWSGSDPFRHGVRELMDGLDLITIPWEQAKQTRFSLGLAASHHAGVADLSENAPLIILSHGIGYTKTAPGTRELGNSGTRELGNSGTRELGNSGTPADAQTFGLSAQWVLDGGRPFAAALGLSHTEQVERLAAAAPAALPTATVIGDPCYDRMLTSKPYRARYRAELGADDRTLVLISSTWGGSSLLGTWPDLIRRLIAESDVDTHRFAIALHPNTWHAHGPGQIRAWLADCERAGALLLPEVDGWRAGLLAADVVVGDHGSVTGYAAALGVPVVLAAFPDEEVAAGSPIAELGAGAPRLRPQGSLLAQLDAAIGGHDPALSARVAELVTSAPGAALPLLRRVCYRVLGIPEPSGDLPCPPLSTPELPPQRPPAFRAEYVLDGSTVRLVRRPVELRAEPDLSAPEHDQLICCAWDHPLRTVRAAASVLTCADPPEGAERWARAAMAAHPGCGSAAVLGAGGCELLTRDGRRFLARAPGLAPEVTAAACHAWLGEAAPAAFTVELVGRAHGVELTAG